MAIVLADNTPRIEYTVAQGVTQTVFPIPFAFFNKEDSSNVDVKVFVDGVERTLGSISTTTFSITSGGNGAKGSLSTTVTGASGGSTVIVLRDTKIGRTTDFPSGGAFEVSKLNTELDTLVAIEGDFEDHVSRSIRLQDKDTAVSLALPLKADRLGKQLGFNATTGAVEMFTPESLAIASDSGSSSVDLTSNTFTFTGGEGIDTSISNQTLTITGELASASNKGVASFNSTNFTVSSGVVTANDITLASDSGSATNTLGETFTLSGGTGLNTSATGSTVTMNVDAAQTGITSLLATDIKIGEDDQTKIDFETADQINFYANNVNVVQLSNTNSGDAVFTVPTSDKDFVIKGNDGGSTITALTIDMSNSGDASFNNNVTVGGNLTVNGSSTTVNTATLTVEDPLISLASGNNSADSVDVGFYGLYDTSGSQDLYAGLFRDASDSGKFKLFKDLQVEPTTTVNTGGTGYAVGTLVANLEGTIQTASQTNITSLGTLTGLTIDGDATFTGTSGNIVFDKSDDSLKFADNVKAKFGTGVDLQIYHDGSDSYIQETGVGNLVIRSSDFRVRTADNTAFILRGSTGGDVRLFYNGSQKFKTQDTGATVTGTLVADGISVGDSETISVGASDDLQISHVTGNNNIVSANSPLYLKTNSSNGVVITKDSPFETMAKFIPDGAVELYYNNEKNFETHIDGVTVGGDKGILQVNGTNASIGTTVAGVHLYADFYRERGFSIFNNSLGSSGLVEEFFMGIPYGDSAQPFVIKTNDQNETALKINQLGSVELYHNNVKKFETTSGGATVTGTLVSDVISIADGSSTGDRLTIGTNNDFFIYHDNQTVIANTTGSGPIKIQAKFGEQSIVANQDAGVQLYYNHSKIIETTSTGVTIEDPSDSHASKSLRIIGKRSDANDSYAFAGKLMLATNRTDQLLDTGKAIGIIGFGGNHTDGTVGNILYSSAIVGRSEGDFNSATDMPTGLAFHTGSTGRDPDTPNISMGTERMRIDKNGNVGIGKTSPAVPLDVAGQVRTTDGSVDLRMLPIDGSNAGIVGTYSNDDLVLNANSSEVMRINTSGNVGIGTTTPSTKLEIAGDLTVTSTDADANVDPSLILYRNSSSPADSDDIGEILFRGRNDNSQDVEYTQLVTDVTDVSDGTEDAQFLIKVMQGGTLTQFASFNGGAAQIYFSKLLNMQGNNIFGVGSQINFEGSTANDFETNLNVTDPTADRTITLPDASGTVLVNSGNQTITGDLTLTSTDSGSGEDPSLILKRDSSSPSSNDNIGNIDFVGENDAGQALTYASISGMITTTTDGNERGRLRFSTYKSGVMTDHTDLNHEALEFRNEQFIRWVAQNGSFFIDLNGGTPTANRDVTLPDLDGTIALTSQLSDIRDKKDVEDLQLGLDFVNAMRPVQFTWDRRDGSYNDVKELGFIAQELDQVERQFDTKERTKLVTEMSEDELHVSPMNSYPILVKAIQELSAQVQSLQARVKELEG